MKQTVSEWRVVAASVVGSAHTASGRPCEDSCWAQSLETSKGEPVLALFVADGAGSAAQGGAGAELAVSAAAQCLNDLLASAALLLDASFAHTVVARARADIEAAAASTGLAPRDYACTFLALVSTNAATLVFQIGDGGVVLDVGSGLELALVPMTGEYANMTHFLSDESAAEALLIKTYPAPTERAAAFSDGLQRLALNMATLKPHEPFFAPFFKVLAGIEHEREDELPPLLVKFLASDAVNQRTDDDKTLALAVRLPG